MSTTTTYILLEAIENRPPNTAVRCYKGVYYAVSSCSVYRLRVRPLEARAFWMTDYRKPVDFAPFLFNMPEGDGSIPSECPKGYLVVAQDGHREEKFWYADILDALAFASQDGAAPGMECDILRIEPFDA